MAESTRRISQLRITIEYVPASTWKRLAGLSKLHLDIVDYPGEWLIDLPLLSMSYAEFSKDALGLAREGDRAPRAKPLLDFLAGTDPAAREDEALALHGSKLFTQYLRDCRDSETQSTLAPGQFLMPGDLEGSPLLTFFPMPLTSDATLPRGSLGAMLERRYESYKAQVIRPFFKDHFARLDRQIVLVDVLSALNRGAGAVRDLDRAMEGVLKAFRPGLNSWLSLLMGRRIEKVLFAATKADHLPRLQSRPARRRPQAHHRRSGQARRHGRRGHRGPRAVGRARSVVGDGDDALVQTLIVDHDNSLYAGGFFDYICSAQAVRGIRRGRRVSQNGMTPGHPSAIVSRTTGPFTQSAWTKRTTSMPVGVLNPSARTRAAMRRVRP